MKKLILAVLLVLPLTAGANESIRLCVQYSDLARVIMELRQDSYDAATLYEESPNKQLVYPIIDSAYKVPLYATDDSKLKAVVEFKSEAFLQCMRAVGDKINA